MLICWICDADAVFSYGWNGVIPVVNSPIHHVVVPPHTTPHHTTSFACPVPSHPIPSWSVDVDVDGDTYQKRINSKHSEPDRTQVDLGAWFPTLHHLGQWTRVCIDGDEAL